MHDIHEDSGGAKEFCGVETNVLLTLHNEGPIEVLCQGRVLFLFLFRTLAKVS
jgi:hypothetical protein